MRLEDGSQFIFHLELRLEFHDEHFVFEFHHDMLLFGLFQFGLGEVLETSVLANHFIFESDTGQWTLPANRTDNVFLFIEFYTWTGLKDVHVNCLLTKKKDLNR